MRPVTSRQRAIPTGSSNATPPRLDRLLISLGCQPGFINDLLGDLRQECATRADDNGRFAAGVWYAREILRSTPHLVWNAVRGGTPATRLRLAAYCVAGIATLSVATIAWVTRDGPPVRLVNGAAQVEGIVVNEIGPVQLSTTVLDAAGHRLERKDVRYQRLSGLPIQISSGGIAKCTERGDAVVRATLGALKTDFVVHCEPVRKIRGAGWGNFVLGQPPRTLGIDAIGLDGLPVTRIAATLRVDDSTVATLNGSQLRPLRPGFTKIDIRIGNQRWGDEVTVFEPVRTFERLRPDQRLVVATVHLTRGASLRFPLPKGVFFLAFGADSSEMPTTKRFIGIGSGSVPQSPIRMTVAGPITCTPLGTTLDIYCVARGQGATATLERSMAAGPGEIVGMLVLEREAQ